MMAPETIRRMSDEAAAKARAKGKQPIEFFDRDHVARFFAGNTLAGEREEFPNLGSHVPDGWKQVDRLFCDHSGFGTDREPALTMKQLREKIQQHVDDGNKYGYGITEVGQFQLWLGVFEKVGAEPSTPSNMRIGAKGPKKARKR